MRSAASWVSARRARKQRDAGLKRYNTSGERIVREVPRLPGCRESSKGSPALPRRKTGVQCLTPSAKLSPSQVKLTGIRSRATYLEVAL